MLGPCLLGASVPVGAQQANRACHVFVEGSRKCWRSDGWSGGLQFSVGCSGETSVKLMAFEQWHEGTRDRVIQKSLDRSTGAEPLGAAVNKTQGSCFISNVCLFYGFSIFLSQLLYTDIGACSVLPSKGQLQGSLALPPRKKQGARLYILTNKCLFSLTSLFWILFPYFLIFGGLLWTWTLES